MYEEERIGRGTEYEEREGRRARRPAGGGKEGEMGREGMATTAQQ